MHRRRTTLGIGAVGTALVAALGVVSAGPASACPLGSQSPKNVIVLIGDGMGYNAVDLATGYASGTTYRQVAVDPATGRVTRYPGVPSTSFERFPVQVGMQTTWSEGSYDPRLAWSGFDYVRQNPTDSAAAVTAMASGVKTYNAGIGVDVDGKPVESVAERAIELDKSAGVVTTVPFSHATPAGYSAHEVNRTSYHAIANDPVRSDLSVVIGAGNPWYDDANRELAQPSYRYISQDDYDALAAGESGWTLVEKTADFEALTSGDVPERLFGMPQVGSTLQQGRPGTSTVPYDVPLNEVPDLSTLTSVALNVLDDDRDGFLLMVEGGAIDWAGHANQTARSIEESLDFFAAVDTVLAWVTAHSSWRDTLVVVTADHETGYLMGPGSDPGFTALGGVAKGTVPVVSWNSGDHTNQLVPLYAIGAGSTELARYASMRDRVRGAYLDNTAVANVLLRDLWADGGGASRRPTGWWPISPR